MSLAENISEHVRRLPESAQAEVLDFVSFLEQRTADRETREEHEEWSRMSVHAAFVGLDVDSESVSYSEDDIKEPYV